MTDGKRIRRDASEWKRLVERYEAGGLSQREFCRREGLNENTFRSWRGRLQSQASSQVPFVEVVPASVPESPWLIELELPRGVTLRMRG